MTRRWSWRQTTESHSMTQTLPAQMAIEVGSVLRRTAVGKIFWQPASQPSPALSSPHQICLSTPVFIFLFPPLLDARSVKGRAVSASPSEASSRAADIVCFRHETSCLHLFDILSLLFLLTQVLKMVLLTDTFSFFFSLFSPP